jgi:hypothetical protein
MGQQWSLWFRDPTTNEFMLLFKLPVATTAVCAWGVFKREAYGVALKRHATIKHTVYLYRGNWRQAKATRGDEHFSISTATPSSFVDAREECFEGIWPAYSRAFLLQYGAPRVSDNEIYFQRIYD